jgi:hypothetical protein
LRTFLNILEELGWPNIYLIDSKQFEKVEGDSIKGNYGISSVDKPVITIKGGIRGRVLKNTIYHEIAHHLFPNKHHWWIECAAEKLAGGGGKGYWSSRYNHSIDELPVRSVLLEMFREATKKFNLKKFRLK